MPVKTISHKPVVSRKPKSKKPVTATGAHKENEEVMPLGQKSKVAIEIEEPELAPAIEEKTDEEMVGSDEESDELGLDDAGLDEELDPFNDKWEA